MTQVFETFIFGLEIKLRRLFMKFIPSWSSKWQKIERAKKIYEIWE